MSNELLENSTQSSENMAESDVETEQFSDSESQPEQDFSDNDEISVNSPSFDKKVSLKKQIATSKYTKVIVISILLISLTVVLTIFFCSSQNAETQEISKSDQPSKTTPVPATDESIKFSKNSYSMKVGKKIKITYEYTPPTKNSKKPKPYVTLSSNNINIVTVDDKGNVKGISTGKTSIVAVTDTGVFTTVPITVEAPQNYTIDDVPLLYQGEKFPSGCESVSSTMLLNYYGFNISVDKFIDDYLNTDYFEFDKNGQMLGPDTYSAFIGSPYSEDSLGCFPPVIETAMNKYLKNKNFRAVDITGSSMEFLLNHYIANDQPVLIWATMWMQESFVTYEWTVKGAKINSPYKDGDTCTWLANEHCMVLIGYDKNNYYLNDPLSNSVTSYNREIFDERYTQMGRCALVLEEITE